MSMEQLSNGSDMAKQSTWRKTSPRVFVVCFLLRNSPASEFYMPTFRNTLFHLHRWIGIKFRCGGITQKKEYNIQNTAKVWNQEFSQSFCLPHIPQGRAWDQTQEYVMTLTAWVMPQPHCLLRWIINKYKMYVDNQKNRSYSKHYIQEILLRCYSCWRCWYLQFICEFVSSGLMIAGNKAEIGS
jgi:hypothetical protein